MKRMMNLVNFNNKKHEQALEREQGLHFAYTFTEKRKLEPLE